MPGVAMKNCVQGRPPISLLEGEMSAKPTEGVIQPDATRERTPPSALPGISPSRGEIGCIGAPPVLATRNGERSEARDGKGCGWCRRSEAPHLAARATFPMQLGRRRSGGAAPLIFAPRDAN